jgi:general secretion pathway protein C
VEALLRKYLWALDLLVVAVCAIFLGRATSSLVESKLPSLPPPKGPPRVVRSDGQTVYAKEIEPILRRNIFCSTCPPIIPVADTATHKEENLAPQKTSLPLQLVAIWAAPEGALISSSVAILRDTESKLTGAFGVGDKVKGATITAIEDKRIDLDNAGKPEFIDLLDPVVESTVSSTTSSSPSIAAAPPPPTSASGSGDALSQELDRGIKKTGEHAYDIQRSTLESVLGNMSLLSRSARIVPEIRDGKAAGFRLYSVRPDGPFAKIGMQNGDVIASINGLEITSPEKALEVYAKLKSASHLSMGLERNGQRITKDYNIR